MTQLLNVSVNDGKYTVIQEADGRLHALRHGQPWERDLAGDKLVLCLAQELDHVRDELLWLQGDMERKDRYIAELRKTINPGADVPAMDPTGHAPGAYTDPGPLTAADLPNVRRAFAERAERSAGLLDAIKHMTKAGTSVEDIEKALQRAAEHLRGQGTGKPPTELRATLAPGGSLEKGHRLLKPAELVAITPTRTETTADFARRVGAVPQPGWRWVEIDHSHGDPRVLRDEPCDIPPGTPLFDADRAIAAFKATVNDAAAALAAKLNTKA